MVGSTSETRRTLRVSDCGAKRFCSNRAKAVGSRWRLLATGGIRAIALTMALVLSAAAAGAADPGAATPPAADDDRNASLTEINKKLTNPVSSIWSITFQQNNYRLTFHKPNSVTRWSSNLLFQPVLPVAITNDWNLITRPVVPLFVSQPHPNPNDPTKNARNTNFGDITLLNMISPSPNLVGNWLLGLGPTWIFPTAGSEFTGQGKWQVGPG